MVQSVPGSQLLDFAKIKQAKRKLKARNLGKGTVANLFPTPAARFWHHFLLHDCTSILKPGLTG